MIDIAVKGVTKAFEIDKKILDGLSFEVNSGERVGLLGKNGAGKTTLFRLIVGELEPDEGEIVIGTGRRIGLISQIPVYPANYTTEDVLLSAHARIFELSAKLDKMREAMAAGEKTDMGLYDALSAEFEALDGWNEEVERNKVANGLDIPPAMRAQLFSSLSGGEKTRVNLARLILENTDILLLDEPTNHLDMKATLWLEDYLEHFRGTVLTISHDRYFLDRVVSRIVEINAGRAEFYGGNYSFYAVEKQARYEEQLKKWEQESKEVKRLEDAAARLYQWGTGNEMLMKKSFAIKTRAERVRTVERPDREKKIRGTIGQKEFRADELMVVRGLTKAYGERTLFSGVELLVKGGERIAVIGDNGTGKSTLIGCLLGLTEADDGFVKLGPAVKAAYLPQIVRFADPHLSVLDTAMTEAKWTAQTARNRLGAFKFSGDDVFKPVSALSGGEQSRLRLCILMKDDINLLVLDEPTNHLDIDSREWMEEALSEYGEALLFVSHDRYFINRFATRIWELEDGKLTDWPCGFEEYRERKERMTRVEQVIKTEKRREAKKAAVPSREKRMATLEKRIAAAEEKIAALDADIEANSTDYEKLQELFAAKTEAETGLEALYEEWSELSEEEQ
ncbi:MAG: ABC-F family ATP-binding cassette domain-containing protein [Oscillospiraceae bacterium]|nr:ABC-F family ATP-binding cassette domain-containing protein [Oscillospiraceae bacterium]